jgi:hypothetical protein
MTDPLLRLLDDLPAAKLDSSRAERIREQCRAALVRHRPRPVGPRASGAGVWTSIVAGLGGVYVTALVRHALAVYGLL